METIKEEITKYTDRETVIKHKELGNNLVIGIVLAKEWFKQHKPLYFPAMPTDYVVCRWWDYHDGIKSNIDGKETIAICKKREDAEVVFESRCSRQSLTQ